MSTENSVYRFAGFELDTRARRLASERGEVPLQPRPFDLLLYLVEHRDRVVSRTELLREVWGANVGPQALGYAVHAVRKALADDGAQQQVLRTVRGSGFQFVAPVDAGPAPLTETHLKLRRGDPPFLGREKLQQMAAGALEEARAGRGGVLLLQGEAGIGKSRAIEHLASMAVRSGFQVFGGRCAMGEGEPAFSPWRQVVHEVAAGRTLEDLARELGVRTADLAWIAAPLGANPPVEELDPWRNKATRAPLFDLVAELIGRAAAETPVFLSIDDIHRSDPASLALLAHLAPLLCEHPVWLIASFRDSDRTELVDLLGQLEQGIAPASLRRQTLEGLDASEIKVLVEALSSVEIAPGLAEALERRTNGNPFFATLLINVLETQKRTDELEGLELEELALPERVYDAVLMQVRDLPRATLDALELASTAGREFLAADLEGALDASRSGVARRLEPAIRERVVYKSQTPGLYGFVHALVQESILASLEAPRRAELHAQLARSIEAQIEGTEWLRASELAHHYLEATPITGTDPALHYLEVAADWASLNMGFEDAVGFLELGIEASRTVPSLPAPHRCRILIKLGKARIRIGRRKGARESFLEATRLASAAGLASQQAEAALCYAPDFLSLETGVVDMEQVDLLERSIDLAPRISQSTHAKLLARLAVALHWSDETAARREDLIAESRAIAGQAGDPESLAYSEIAARLAAFSVSDPDTMVSAQVARGVDPLLLLMARLLKITGNWLNGKIGFVRREIQEFADLANQLKEPRVLWYSDLWRSTLAHMEGRFGDAARYGSRFFLAGQQVGDLNAAQSFVLQDFMCGIDCGGYERYEVPIQKMVEQFPRVTGWRGGWLLFLVEQSRLDEAGDTLDVLLAEGALAAPKRNEWFALIGAMTIAAERVGHRQCAEALLVKLQPHADQLALVGYGSYCFGSVHQLIGQCHSALGEFPLAEHHFRRAIEVNRVAGARPAMARALSDLARLYATNQRDHERIACLRHAASICSQLGMYRLRRRLREVRS